ncbi:hypothetical protein JHK85_001649 [Glycine max]|nr:hypothetical protein JHK87_001602 [Glycine soja]KAG5069272.1 hypothetical protein JHK85_001649 [Glycine max]
MSYSDSAAASASDSNENACNGAAEEVAIRIIEAGKQESGSSPSSLRGRGGELGGEEAVVGRSEMLSYRWRMAEERVSLVSLDDGARDSSSSSSSSTYQRYDIQQVAKWIEHILSFSLLLLIVFIRQHLQEIMLDTRSSSRGCYEALPDHRRPGGLRHFSIDEGSPLHEL